MAAGFAREGAAIDENAADLNDADVPATASSPPPQPDRSVETENAPKGSMGAPTSIFRVLRREKLGCSCMSSCPVLWVDRVRFAAAPVRDEGEV
jgi:hypothetical protein